MRSLFVQGGFRYPVLSSTVPVAETDSVASATASAAGGISAFPNPAVSGVTIKLADPSSVGGLLEVYDQLGRRVLTMRITSTELQLDVTSWSVGIYFIRVGGGKNGETAKLVKI
jgi:hypothetical protein